MTGRQPVVAVLVAFKGVAAGSLSCLVADVTGPGCGWERIGRVERHAQILAVPYFGDVLLILAGHDGHDSLKQL